MGPCPWLKSHLQVRSSSKKVGQGNRRKENCRIFALKKLIQDSIQVPFLVVVQCKFLFKHHNFLALVLHQRLEPTTFRLATNDVV